MREVRSVRPRALGYVRVSTEEQEESGLGVAAQIRHITDECQRRGWDLELLMDLACSGKHINPELRRGLGMLRAGRADTLVVTKMDRLARSTKNAADIIETAQVQGWNLVMLDVAIDLTTPSGEAMANMLATFAQFERRMISQRTKEALAARKREGKHNGRRTSIPADLLNRICERREAGDSFAIVARDLARDGYVSPTGLTRWQESTVRRAYLACKEKESPNSAAPAAP
ncbi:recombinase family protein [Pseudarthrobacter sp. MDT3-28]|uniref:recombinase family protein n=1 Tax=Pseudarthrobacter raffinosi TaxID=2953651 RepID=UPI00208E777A|nr:recombinase family protein [Pseudarthrobacter sp. MDT3-28]MCO4239567.1 recombinase family protein [Pseudarthrobacter sp. MDT3-28]